MVGLLEFLTNTNVITADQFERVSSHLWCFHCVCAFLSFLWNKTI